MGNTFTFMVLQDKRKRQKCYVPATSSHKNWVKWHTHTPNNTNLYICEMWSVSLTTNFRIFIFILLTALRSHNNTKTYKKNGSIFVFIATWNVGDNIVMLCSRYTLRLFCRKHGRAWNTQYTRKFKQIESFDLAGIFLVFWTVTRMWTQTNRQSVESTKQWIFNFEGSWVHFGRFFSPRERSRSSLT